MGIAWRAAKATFDHGEWIERDLRPTTRAAARCCTSLRTPRRSRARSWRERRYCSPIVLAAACGLVLAPRLLCCCRSLRRPWIYEHANHFGFRHQLAQHLQPFRPEFNENRVTPVTLPPGRLRLATRPALTGSSPVVNTIGIVELPPLPPELSRRHRSPPGVDAQVRPPWPVAARIDFPPNDIRW